ncbi:GNAT family N-acetyltransferase [Oceanicola sp. S124]|uniref:GNAT family N-acetyltransferase n=1 Tax=Oceanicola sp. S124 TaxID=1042378 RepID=UPI0002559C65|nr:GNAT family N-acetyltransferase [Oceanicola sp. S124]
MPLSSDSVDETPPDSDSLDLALLPARPPVRAGLKPKPVAGQQTFIRPAMPADTDAVTRMLARSYRALLAADYPSELLREALPFIKRPRPGLLTCGTYFLTLTGDEERVLSAGGWTDTSPHGAPGRPGEGHVRHVATDPDAARQGLGRELMAQVMRSACSAGVELLHCQSTLTAVPFYEALGFQARSLIELRLPNGVLFPAVQMFWRA